MHSCRSKFYPFRPLSSPRSVVKAWLLRRRWCRQSPRLHRINASPSPSPPPLPPFLLSFHPLTGVGRVGNLAIGCLLLERVDPPSGRVHVVHEMHGLPGQRVWCGGEERVSRRKGSHRIHCQVIHVPVTRPSRPKLPVAKRKRCCSG